MDHCFTMSPKLRTARTGFEPGSMLSRRPKVYTRAIRNKVPRPFGLYACARSDVKRFTLSGCSLRIGDNCLALKVQ